MEKSLIKLARLGPPVAPAGRMRNSGSIRIFVPAPVPPPAAPAAQAAPEPESAKTAAAQPTAAQDPELLSRLARLEAMVAALERQAPATRDLFDEWVRRRQVEEISFAEFLRRRRAGVS